MTNEILSVENITKSFPGVQALSGVSFSLEKGEIHALVGANGAGKSTLIKTLAGVHMPDSGTIRWMGEPVQFKNPSEAMHVGIAVIYQEFNLFPDLDIAKNIFFGREYKNKFGLVDWDRIHREAQEVIDTFELELDSSKKVRELSVAQQQMVEIAKALSHNAKVIIMDEPTATLTHREVQHLFEIIHKLKEKGVSLIYISHRLDEVTQISNRLTVLRNGKVVDTAITADVTKDWIVRKMVGESINNVVTKNSVITTEAALEVKNLTNSNIKDVSFRLNKGEVLGIAGLVGAGRTELVRAIFGADPISEGSIIVNGTERKIKNITDAIKNGIGLLPESRKEQGLLLNLNIRRNISYANLKKFTKCGLIQRKTETDEAQKRINDVKIVTPSPEFMVVNLSGGNQQKVVLGKWLCVNSDILILDEPTRGVDVGAKEEIFASINRLVEQGKSIIFISSELEEVMRVSNRIITMYKGRITAEIAQCDATLDDIMLYCTGGVRT